MNKIRAAKKGEEGERVVESLLSKDSSFHRLINNLVLLGDNNISHQIDHIFIRQNGVFVIETKNYYGEIKGQEDDSFWTRSYFAKGKLKTASFLNPLKQNNSHIRIIKRLIGREYPIYCFVTFTQNNVNQLGLFNVCNADELLKRIKLITSDRETSEEEIEKIYQVLLYNEADINNEQHVNKVKEAEKDRKEYQKKMRLAIEKKICPNCGKTLVIKNGQLVCPFCKAVVKI